MINISNTNKINHSKANQYDIIGDVHGRWDKLEPLLSKLGYQHDGQCHAHPEGRIALFLGNLICPRYYTSNGTIAVLHHVQKMATYGQAYCILGDHEYNFVAYHTPNGLGGFLSPHDEKEDSLHQDFFDPSDIQEVYLPWIKTLPFFLDLPELRAVHACWHPEYVSILDGKTLADENLLRISCVKGTPEYCAVETLLKGVDLPVSYGHSYYDHQGNKMTEFHARWWDKEVPFPTTNNMFFPPREDYLEIPFNPQDVDALPGYGSTEKPVFFGHYSKSANSSLELEATNVCCLGIANTNDNPLAAYRFEGSQDTLDKTHIALSTDKELGLTICEKIVSFFETMPGVGSNTSNAMETFSSCGGKAHYNKQHYDVYLEMVTHVLNKCPKPLLMKAWTADTKEGRYFLATYRENHDFDTAPTWDDYLTGCKNGSMPLHYLDLLRMRIEDMQRQLDQKRYLEDNDIPF